ncbi:MAG: septum formation initiator family protein [Candidatus Omnitrophica bacterium]|nr:septum formation initiator family protein [Candidatus Omnitrophota bacterium]
MIFRKIPFKFFIIGVILVIIYLPGFVKIERLSSHKKELESKIKRLREENEKMVQEIDRLHHDPAYIEKVAREELKMGKEGEIIYKVVPGKK